MKDTESTCMAKDRGNKHQIRCPCKRDLECISINNNTRIFHVTSSLSLFVFFLFRRKCSRNFRVSDDAMFGQALYVQYRSQEYSNLGGESLDTPRVAKLIVHVLVYFCFIPLFSYRRELECSTCCKASRYVVVFGSVRCYPGGESLNASRVAKLTYHVDASGSVLCYPGGESLNAPRVAKLTQHVVVSGSVRCYP